MVDSILLQHFSFACLLILLGVNTGFGGSADTHTNDVDMLQSNILEDLRSGISCIVSRNTDYLDKNSKISPFRLTESADVVEVSTCMPRAWIRASILICINTLAHGLSGVRPCILQSMNALLKHDIVPHVPLRGSISASGDLMPLSYIAGAIQGNLSVQVENPRNQKGGFSTISAESALKDLSISPAKLMPKEGLAIVNGTAFSAALAALVIHDANCLAVTSQVLAAMSVEALCGSVDSFDPIFGFCRPHPGQIEAAHNIKSFLAGSALARRGSDHHGISSLAQDRYSIRTASEWIGPVLEDLLLANQQVSIECNSVTDNPLIDVGRGGGAINGGNFQAKVITAAMEKTRSGAQSLGQMLYAQCSEMINSKLNNGLPPNLTADEPSRSFLMKPLDVMTAALQSELGFLANSAGSHVQSAVMGNQALNSLALISARYTHTALDILTQLAAAHLLALCQALDLRAMHASFLRNLHPLFEKAIATMLFDVVTPSGMLDDIQGRLWLHFEDLFDQSTSMDASQRFLHIFRSLQSLVVDVASSTPETVIKLREWTNHCAETTREIFIFSRETYLEYPDAVPILGVAARRIYSHVRHDLSVPFFGQKEIRNLHNDSTSGERPVQGPFESVDAEVSRKYSRPEGKLESLDVCNVMIDEAREGHPHPGYPYKEQQSRDLPIGNYVSLIYEAFRAGDLYKPVFECLEEQATASSSPYIEVNTMGPP